MKTRTAAPWWRFPGHCAKYDLPDSLYAYLAYGGTTGSAKDALAEGMLALATEKAFCSRARTVIECSSGSFAVALAVACAHSRHPLMLCMPATVPLERQQMLTKFGAQIVLSNYVYGRRGVEQRAQEAVEQTGGYFLNYFDNDLNAEFHRRVTGPNIAKATGGALDAVVAGVGSGGHYYGRGRIHQGMVPGCKGGCRRALREPGHRRRVHRTAQHPGPGRGLCAGKL